MKGAAMFDRFRRSKPTTYAQSVPVERYRKTLARWHKVNKKDKNVTFCNIPITDHWNRSDEFPPDGQARCFFCFKPNESQPELEGRHAKGRT
jgi:hypothetical protein